MTTTSNDTPLSSTELETLAERYNTHDTGAEMTSGVWIDPTHRQGAGSVVTEHT